MTAVSRLSTANATMITGTQLPVLGQQDTGPLNNHSCIGKSHGALSLSAEPLVTDGFWGGVVIAFR